MNDTAFHISLSTHDLARSAAFYEDLLGFPEPARIPEGNAQISVYLPVPGLHGYGSAQEFNCAPATIFRSSAGWHLVDVATRAVCRYPRNIRS